MTTTDAAQPQPQAANWTVLGYGLHGIFRASRIKAALMTKQKAEANLIEFYQEGEKGNKEILNHSSIVFPY